MAKLVIVESPAKAKTIGKYLGKDYEVTASMGHIRDLPKSQLGIDVEHDYAPQYINIKDKSKLIKELKAKYPWYTSYTIKAGTYPNQDKDVKTSAIKMVMFCRGDLPEDVVYQLTKTLWEHMDELGQSQKNLKGLTAENAVKDIADIPLHPGAAKYYKEIGVLK